MNDTPAVCVVGSVALDRIATPRDERIDCLGGSASYACVAAAKFVTTGMVGIVGDDFPPEFREVYRRAGIDLAGLQTAQGRTFRWHGAYADNMIDRTTLDTQLNVFERFSPQLPAHYRNTPFLMLGNIAPELQLHVLSQVNSPRFVMADTMDLWIRIAREALHKMIARVDMLMLNDSEARLLTGERSLPRCADAIRRMGPSYVVIKKGEHGALLFSPKGACIIPAFLIPDVVDPTGAGDCFAGGFLGALAQHGSVTEASLRRSLHMGAVVASFGVEAFSLDRLIAVTPAQLDVRFVELCDMTRFEPHALG